MTAHTAKRPVRIRRELAEAREHLSSDDRALPVDENARSRRERQ
jgi:hypothetical protein